MVELRPFAYLVFAIAAPIALSTGCRQAGDTIEVGVTRIDSAGVTIITIPEAAVTNLRQWELDESPVLSVGAGQRPDDVHLVRVSGATFVNEGQIAVASDLSKQILLFDKQGKSIENLGRMGRGPGEFQHLQLVRDETRGGITAVDLVQKRITRFETPSAPPAVVTYAQLAVKSIIPEQRFANGDLLVRQLGRLPAPAPHGVTSRRERVFRLSDSGRVLADYGEFRGHERVYRANIAGLEAPYASRLLAAASGNFVFLAQTGPYEIRKYTANGTLDAVIRINRPRKLVTTDIIQHYRIRVMKNATDPGTEREWTALSADDVFPEHLPAFDQMVVDSEGRVWIRETAAETERDALWLVLSQDGEPKGSIRLPSGFSITDVLQNEILGVQNDFEQPEHVRVYRFDVR